MKATNNPKIKIPFKRIFIDTELNKAYFLGYHIPLTKTEIEILHILLESQISTLSAQEIADRTSVQASKENVVYHISNINKKAHIIGNRKIILNIAKSGYFLNPEM